MDVAKILKRAWQILWNYRALWVFGLILALTVGGGGGSSGSGWRGNQRDFQPSQPSQVTPGQDFQQGMQEFRDWLRSGTPGTREFRDWLDSSVFSPGGDWGNATTWIWIGVIILVLLLVTSIVAAIVRYVSETSVIRMVNEYEDSGVKVGVRQGWRYGWSRTAWRLFLINLIVNLPILLVILVLLLVGLGIFLFVSQGNPWLTVPGIVGGVGLAFLVIFLVVILSIVLNLLRHFFWRVCALEEVGVRESFRRGFAMVRQNWKSVGLMWLVMVGLGIGWGIASIIAFFLLIPLYLLFAIPGLLVAAIPALLGAGIASLFLSGYVPWIVGAIFAIVPFLLITFLPITFLRGLWLVYTSTVWTLTYRELMALPALAIEAPVEPEPQPQPQEEA